MATRIMFLIALIFGLLSSPVFSARQFVRGYDLSKFTVPSGWILPVRGGQFCDADNNCRDSVSPPSSNKTLALIALGRGTFNYSCEDAEPANAPAYLEQYTELYDATPFLPLLVDEDTLRDYVQQLFEYDYGDVKNTSLECIGAIGSLDRTAVITLYEIDTFEAYLEETVPSPSDPEFNGVWSHSRSSEYDWEVYRVEMVGVLSRQPATGSMGRSTSNTRQNTGSTAFEPTAGSCHELGHDFLYVFQT